MASRAVPPRPLRMLQRLGMKRGAYDFERRNLRPLAAARETVLGEAAAGPPRFLVRVDEFPLAGAYDENPRHIADLDRFHAIMSEAGVPYLMAVSSGVARDYLDPSGERQPAAVGPRAGRARAPAAATRSRSRSTASTTGPGTPARGTARSSPASTASASSSCSTPAPPASARPGSGRMCSFRRSTASTRASTTSWRSASTSSAAGRRASRCSATTARRCGAGRPCTCPPTSPSTDARPP